MAKLTHSNLTQLSSNETSAVNTINANGALTEAALENTLSRDGSTPNTMSAAIDMNSNKLLNVSAGTVASDGVNLAQLTAATGQVPGLSMTMETTQTDSDQGNGKVWFNAAVASATIIYLDDLDSGGGAISTFVQTWDNSTNTGSRGYIYVVQKVSGVNYAVFEIDGAVTDASGYTKIPVNYMGGDGTLADTDAVSVHFTRTGDTGATGSTGSTGSTGVTGPSAGFQMTWETATTDTDQGVGKVWANNATLSSATVLYFDDVENNSVNINTFIDTLDDASATNSAMVYIQEGAGGGAGVIFKVSGAVTSATTYSKVAVTHVATIGTLVDGDVIGVTFALSGDNGAGSGDFLADGSVAMTGSFDINGQTITNTGTLTLPTSSDTLVGKATTDTLTNKTFDANGTGNSITNIDTADITNNAITLAKLAGGTDGNLISYDTAGDPVAVATGSSAQVLTSNGAGQAPTFQTASGGGLIFISSVTASNVASVAFTSGIDTTYDEYIIKAINVHSANDNVSMRFTLSTDGGSSYITGSSYDWRCDGANDGGTDETAGAAGGAYIQVHGSGALGNAAAEAMDFEVSIMAPSATTNWTKTYSKCIHTEPAGGQSLSQTYGGGQIKTLTAINAIKFAFSAGNVSSGGFYLFGIVKS